MVFWGIIIMIISVWNILCRGHRVERLIFNPACKVEGLIIGMESKAAKQLSTFLTVVVVFLSVCDVFLMISAPWWLKYVYEGDFGDIKVMLGYDFSNAGMIYPLMLAFFIICGLLCLGILFASFRILLRIRQDMPFCVTNAVSMRNASICGLGLFLVFMAKMFFSPSILTFVCGGIFLLFSLFVMVLSELVRVAARIKEENELTI